MPRDPIPCWFFVKVVVRRDDQFLLVQEQKRNQPWHLPAGRVERGETFATAAARETLEEAGIPIVLDGVLRVEHSPHAERTYTGVIFLAHPASDVPPKSVPDDESLGAGWFRLDEARQLRMREPDVLELLRHVRDGGPVYPMALLGSKGQPW